MAILKKQEKKSAAEIAFLLGIVLFSFMSCKSPSSPEENLTTTVTLNNVSGTTADVFMDGTFKVSIDNQYSGDIENVTAGSHLFEAKKTGTEILILTASMDIDTGYTYTLIIEGPSTITVTNEYGETLQLTMDGTSWTDLEDQTKATLNKVPFGVHNLAAAKKSDGTEVASTTIDVEEVKEYSWTITK
jgi:hypothetical protein